MKLEVINMLSFYHANKFQFRVSENEILNPLREPLFDCHFVLTRYSTGLIWCLQPQMAGSFFKAP